VACIRLYANYFTARRMLLANKSTAGDEAATADSSEEVIEFPNFVEEFESRRTLAGDDLFVVEGRNIGHFTFFNLLRNHLIQIVFEAIKEHDLSTITSYGCLFNIRGIRGENDASLDAKKLTCKGNSLTMISSRVCQATCFLLLRSEVT
jgi:hypothetical protein